MAKLNSKDIELLTNTIMQQVYDDNIVDNLKKEQAEKAWKEFEKSSNYKHLLVVLKPLFENGFVQEVAISNSIFNDTIAKGDYSYKNQFDISSIDGVKDEFIRKSLYNIKIDFPSFNEIYNQVKSTLVVECLVGKDLQGVVSDLTKSIKAKLENTKPTIK